MDLRAWVRHSFGRATLLVSRDDGAAMQRSSVAERQQVRTRAAHWMDIIHATADRTLVDQRPAATAPAWQAVQQPVVGAIQAEDPGRPDLGVRSVHALARVRPGTLRAREERH